MAGKVLSVLARGTASVPLHSAHARGIARFVGRVDDVELGTPFVSVDETGQKTQAVMPARVCSADPTVFARDNDSQEFAELLKALAEGDLWPFDEASARIAGVAFDPTYGGEYELTGGGKLVNVAHRDALAALKKERVGTVFQPSPSIPDLIVKPVSRNGEK